MLQELTIENIAVIEQVSLPLSSGFTVLTGETGAGKSMLLGALHGLMGERMGKDIIRHGAEKAYMSGVFTNLPPQAVALLEENGYTVEEDTLLLQRTISQDGKSSCRIGTRPATLSLLKEVTPLLLNIHGQHENYQLLSPQLHRQYIDQMGKLEPLLAEYQQVYHAMRQTRRAYKALQQAESQKQEQLALLRYRMEELSAADIQVGEQEELLERRNQFRHREQLAHCLEQARHALFGEEEQMGAVSLLALGADALEAGQDAMAELSPLAEKLREAEDTAQGVQSRLRDLQDSLDFDPIEQEQVEERLDLLYRLMQKYGDGEEKLLQVLAQTETELAQIEGAEEQLTKLNETYEVQKAQAIALARTLSQKRKETAEDFRRKVQEQLSFLDMAGIAFSVVQTRVPLKDYGCDEVEFYIATNQGEEARPLAKIASGGELSRIMLAIKTVLSSADLVDTLIFDEVDTGISGSTAEKVGLLLRSVAKNHQVLCVTHLAQIAALGQTQLRIYKEQKEGRTYTRVEQLDYPGRVQEVARIMGGTEQSPLLLQTAEDLLRRGQTG